MVWRFDVYLSNGVWCALLGLREFILVMECGCSDPPHLAVMCLVSPW